MEVETVVGPSVRLVFTQIFGTQGMHEHVDAHVQENK
eukprot:SAG11_NODE_18996_length_476_cov_0.941645_2_plen_36_part_01